MELTFRKAVKNDADMLIEIYNSSFYDDYVFYGECPAYGQTKEQMERSIADYTKYIVLSDNTPVGVLSFKDKGDAHYYLGCLCVIPAYQGIGIGTKSFQYMLSVCPDWKEITLVTPADKKQNIKFYTEKCGFNMGKIEMDGKVEVINFYMNR
jgi:ribosomal protein S18 acetylase RimI-like enzyme